ncbi:MAG: hypothetical protein HYX57_08855 [Chloroflexi bacterium]|nr:hypothetical protein [Chloroflexota bacterium]
MAVSQTAPTPAALATVDAIADSGASAPYARFAGAGLLVALASLVVLYGGSGAIAGTRPDTATDATVVSAYFGRGELTFLLWQGIVSAAGIAFFALAYRRYLSGFATTPLARQLADFGIALALFEIPIVIVAFGIELAVVKLAQVGDPSLLGVFTAWTWVDNGMMLWLEFGWVGVLSLVAWQSGALPRWLAGYGLIVAILLLVLAVPGLVFGYPLGLNLVAYGPFMIWFLLMGIYLVRGGRAPEHTQK